MSHKVIALPTWIKDPVYTAVCELNGNVNSEDDVTCCSHWDHCEREAVIWIYSDLMITALCQVCYDWCYPTTEQWYRVVKISADFHGKL